VATRRHARQGVRAHTPPSTATRTPTRLTLDKRAISPPGRGRRKPWPPWLSESRHRAV
jgi:hypothetical protein